MDKGDSWTSTMANFCYSAPVTAVKSLNAVVDHVPGLGHVKAGYSYVIGDTEGAGNFLGKANRTTAVMFGGALCSLAGGLPGAAACGMAAGLGYDTYCGPVDEAAQEESVMKTRVLRALSDATLGRAGAQVLAGVIYPQFNDVTAVATEVNAAAKATNWLGLGKAGLDNRANQLNPNHLKSGAGRVAGYLGLGTRADLNNHSNQLNPNNPAFWLSKL